MIILVNIIIGFFIPIFIIGINSEVDSKVRRNGNIALVLVALLYRFLWGKSVTGFNILAIAILVIIGILSFKYMDQIIPTLQVFSKLISNYLQEIRNTCRTIKTMMNQVLGASSLLLLFGIVGYYDRDRVLFLLLGILLYLILVETVVLNNQELHDGLNGMIESIRTGLKVDDSTDEKMYEPIDIDEDLDDEDLEEVEEEIKPKKKKKRKIEIEEEDENDEDDVISVNDDDVEEELEEKPIPNTNIGLGKPKIGTLPPGIGVPPPVTNNSVNIVPPVMPPIGGGIGIPKVNPINNGIVKPPTGNGIVLPPLGDLDD